MIDIKYDINDKTFYFVDGNGKVQGNFVLHSRLTKHVLSRCNFVDGLKNGLCEEYDFGGRLVSRGNYVNGKKQGLHFEYFSNSAISSLTSYEEGKMHGIRFIYSKTGKVLSYGYFEYGKLHGEYRKYYVKRNGKNENCNHEVDGFQFESSGSLCEVRNYVNGELHGDYIKYCRNGRCYRSCMFYHGDKIRVDPRKLSPQDRMYVLLSGRPPVKTK